MKNSFGHIRIDLNAKDEDVKIWIRDTNGEIIAKLIYETLMREN